MGGGKDKHNEEEKGVFSHLAHGVAQAAHGYPPGAYPPPPGAYPPYQGYPPAGYPPHGYPGSSAPHGMISRILFFIIKSLISNTNYYNSVV